MATVKKSQSRKSVNNNTLQCPDCDTPLPVVSKNKKTGKQTYQIGAFNCVECLTLLIVTETDGVFNIRVKPPLNVFHHSKPTSIKNNGVVLNYDPGHEPEIQPSKTLGVVCCVSCDTEIQSTVNTIRARVFKTYIPKEVDSPFVDPDTGESVKVVSKIPLYETGRLCKSCQSRLNATTGNKPPKHGEFEYLHERIGFRKRHPVTRGMAKSLDLQLERETSTPRFHDMGDVLIPAVPEVEEVDVTAYRAFHRMGSKSKKHVDFNERNR